MEIVLTVPCAWLTGHLTETERGQTETCRAVQGEGEREREREREREGERERDRSCMHFSHSVVPSVTLITVG